MMKEIVLKLLLASAILAVIVWLSRKSSKSDTEKFNKRLMNHVKFSGVITYVNKSDNHNFSIIGVKLEDTNTASFWDADEVSFPPYRIKNGYAELYRNLPYHAEVGVKVVVDSDKRTVQFYRNGQLLNEADIRYSGDATNYNFVKENSRLK